MRDVIVYLWVEMWEMGYYLDPEYWEHEPGCPPLHVSLEDPYKVDGLLANDEMMSATLNFILLKRKIFRLPSCLRVPNDDVHKIYYQDARCDLAWDAPKNTVVAKGQYGEFPLIPAD